MKFKLNLYLAIICLFPYIIDFAIQNQENNGNLGMQGVFMDIKFHRNIVYASIGLGLILNYFSKYIIASILIVFTIYKYFYIITKYEPFINNIIV